MSHTPGQPSSSRAPQSRVLGPAVITLGFILFLTSILMRWNPVPSFGARELNAMQYANGLIGDSAWTNTGVLLMVGLVLTIVSAVICLSTGWVSAFLETGSAALRVILLTSAIVGFTITVVTLISYIAVYGVRGMQVALWVYPLAFLVILLGGVGIASKRR